MSYDAANIHGFAKTLPSHGALMGLDQLKNALKGIPPESLKPMDRTAAWRR